MATNAGPKKRAGIYCRISLKKKTENEKNPVPKVEAQEAMCRNLAKAHEDIDIVKVYVDDGVSASTFKGRPGWDEMLADVKSGKLDVLLATAEDRFTRQPLEKETVMLLCADAGVTWLTVNDGAADPATADGALMAGLRGLLGRYEVNKSGKRKRDLNEVRRANGVIPHNGPRPFGWDEDRVTLNRGEAQLIREAYADLIAGDKTCSAIATAWNRAGVPTTRGGRWDIPKVQAVLKRPRNVGWITYKGALVLGADGGPVRARCEAIVDEDTFKSALAVLGNPERARRKEHQPKYLAASLALCGPCGAPMRSAKNRGHAVYRCATHDGYGPKRADLRHAHIRVEELDKIVTEAVVSAVMFSGTDALPDPDTKALNSLHERLSTIRRAQADLLDLLGTGDFKAAEVAAKKRSMDAEAEKIEKEIAGIAQRNARAALLTDAQALLWSARRVSITEAVMVRAEIRERFQALSLVHRRALIRGLLHVTVSNGRGQKRVEVRHLVATALNEEGDEVA